LRDNVDGQKARRRAHHSRLASGHVMSTLVITVVVWIAGVAFAARFGHLVDTCHHYLSQVDTHLRQMVAFPIFDVVENVPQDPDRVRGFYSAICGQNPGSDQLGRGPRDTLKVEVSKPLP
jgi:hypothetical protein